MSEAATAPQRSPLGAALRYAVLFAALGPLVAGTVAAAVVTLLLTRLDGAGPSLDDVGDALRALAADVFIWAPEAYAAGTAPAALAGLAVGAFGANRKSPVVYLVAAVAGALAAVPAGLGDFVGQIVLLALDGAVAAVICTAVARRFSLRSRV
jgi:hypothetical protein